MFRRLLQLFARPPEPPRDSERTVVVVGVTGFTPVTAVVGRPALLVDWRDLITPEIKRRRGRLAALSGDDLFCVFRSAIDAVDAARAMTETLNARRLPGSTIAARAGVATGNVFAGDIPVPGGVIAAVTGGAVRVAGLLMGRAGAAGVAVLMCSETAALVVGKYAARPAPNSAEGGAAEGTAYEPVRPGEP